MDIRQCSYSDVPSVGGYINTPFQVDEGCVAGRGRAVAKNCIENALNDEKLTLGALKM